MTAIEYYEIEVIDNHVKLKNNYDVEVGKNKLYKLIDDGYIVAPFSDLNDYAGIFLFINLLLFLL